MSAPDPASPAWRWPARAVFGFFCTYWLLYALPFPINQFPDKENLEKLSKHVAWTEPAVAQVLNVTDPIANWLDRFILTPWREAEQTVVPWVGKNVLGLEKEITYFMSGSGDKTSDYMKNLLILVLALVGALIWPLLGFALGSRAGWRTMERWLYEFLRIYVRYVLGATMLAYGSYKIVPLQMPPPSLDRLMQPVGELSPMGMLWTFMGTSAAYSCFAGLGEALAGLLLFFRRTTTLGALLTIAVMGNVVAMNFCYDVPVKLYSSNLLLMAVFLLAPDLGRLVSVLLLNRPAAPRDLGPPWKNLRWLHWPLLAVKLLFVAWLLYVNIVVAVWLYLDREDRPRAEFAGLYEVIEFKRNEVVQPPLLTDHTQWRQMIFHPYTFQGRGFCTLRHMDDRVRRCSVVYDKKKQTLTISPRDQAPADPAYGAKPAISWTMAVGQPGDQLLALEGVVDGEKLQVKLKQASPPEFQLLSRGFHWVQKYPYNR